MRFALVLVLPVLAAACLPSDPVAQTPDANVTDSSSADATVGDAASDTGASDGGIVDASSDGSLDFCQTPYAAGAAFCDDFETASSPGSKWDDTTTSGGGTVALDALAYSSTKAAVAKMNGGSSVEAKLGTIVLAGGTKSKVTVEFQGYWDFPSWPSNATNLFLAVVLRTGSSTSTQFFIEIERGTNWELLTTGTSGTTFPNFAANGWHHFRVSYDASGATGDMTVMIDNTPVASISKAKGTPPIGAPATFDRILLELGIQGGPAISSSFRFDNVLVRYP